MGIVSMLGACSSEDEPALNLSSESDNEISELIVRYDGKEYHTFVINDNDSIIYLNKEYAKLYSEEIKENISNMAICLEESKDGKTIVSYYPSEDELVEQTGIKQVDQEVAENILLATRGSGMYEVVPPSNEFRLGTAELYDDRNFKDRGVRLYVTATYQCGIPSLGDLNGFNDKTSSIKVFNNMEPATVYHQGPLLSNFTGMSMRPCLKCYHNSDFKGTVIFCIGKQAGSGVDHLDYNLKNIGWNDRISSVEFFLISREEAENGEKGQETNYLPHNPC